jgi:hypothetical protein
MAGSRLSNIGGRQSGSGASADCNECFRFDLSFQTWGIACAKAKGADRNRRPEQPKFEIYMLLFVQVFVAASQCIFALPQAALVVGVLSAARLGVAKAAASPTATTTETSFFIGTTLPIAIAPLRVFVAWDNGQKE